MGVESRSWEEVDISTNSRDHTTARCPTIIRQYKEAGCDRTNSTMGDSMPGGPLEEVG